MLVFQQMFQQRGFPWYPNMGLGMSWIQTEHGKESKNTATAKVPGPQEARQQGDWCFGSLRQYIWPILWAKVEGQRHGAGRCWCSVVCWRVGAVISGLPDAWEVGGLVCWGFG